MVSDDKLGELSFKAKIYFQTSTEKSHATDVNFSNLRLDRGANYRLNSELVSPLSFYLSERATCLSLMPADPKDTQ